MYVSFILISFFFSSRRRHTRFSRDWSSDVCSSDLLPLEFPQLRSLSPPRQNLPPLAARLIGRERELEEVQKVLRRPDVRVLTLIGPGGVGKTRLALALAAELQASFLDGAWFVDLSAIRDPNLVVPTIAHALGLQDA